MVGGGEFPHVDRGDAWRGARPDDPPGWVELLDRRGDPQPSRLPAEDRPYRQGAGELGGIDLRLPSGPGGDVGLEVPDDVCRCVDERLVAGDDRCVGIDLYSIASL